MATPDQKMAHETALAALNPPQPSPAAQQAALQAALAAFAEVQAAQLADNQKPTASGQGRPQDDRLTGNGTAMPPPAARESFMQRAAFLRRMTLSLLVVGAVGLVGYQSWHSNEVGLTESAALRQAAVGAGTNNGALTGAKDGRVADAAQGKEELKLAEALPQIMSNAQPADTEQHKNRVAEPVAAPAKKAEAPPAVDEVGWQFAQMSGQTTGTPALLGYLRDKITGAATPDAEHSRSAAAPPPTEADRKMPAAKPVPSFIEAQAEANKQRVSEKDGGTVRRGNDTTNYTVGAFGSGQGEDMAADRISPVESKLKAAERVAPGMMLNKAAPTSGMVAPLPRPVAPLPPEQERLRADDDADRHSYRDEGRDRFEAIKDNPVLQVSEAPVSTFSLDVDTSSYAFIRRSLNEGRLPPKDAVRYEELINYFDYAYAVPDTREAPFQPSVTLMPTPWNAKTKLLHIGIKGYDLPKDKRPPANLVFLVDTSGSMNEPSKLPLAQNALKLLVETLQPADRVAIVTYAGNAGTVLEPTAASEKQKILSAIDTMRSGGSTAGAAGIRQAYELAKAHYNKEGVNRVILATDGDFNVGITDPQELQGYVERERQSGVFLSILGFGTGNYNDALMQKLAQNGNGTAAYIDNLNEARRVLVDEAGGTLFTIAKDVKIQVEFNPALVSEYRLIGYETRALQREDFNNDKVDAGDVGAGADVTALYEITTADSDSKLVDELRYAAKPATKAEDSKADADKAASGEYGFLKIRYKLPDSDTSKLITTPITAQNLRGLCAPGTRCDAVQPSDDARFAAAVAGFGQLLRGGKYTGSFSYDDVITLAGSAKGQDAFGLRSEFVNLVRLAKNLPAMRRP